ncbi:hypothetical protein HOH87_04495 [bacterium]|jgi:hypothetical protein|nr:hypothetical protein [bacterium]
MYLGTSFSVGKSELKVVSDFFNRPPSLKPVFPISRDQVNITSVSPDKALEYRSPETSIAGKTVQAGALCGFASMFLLGNFLPTTSHLSQSDSRSVFRFAFKTALLSGGSLVFGKSCVETGADLANSISGLEISVAKSEEAPK